MDNRSKILSVVNLAISKRIAKLTSQGMFLEQESLKNDLIKVLNGFLALEHIKEFRINVHNMMYDCNQFPNNIDIDIWTKHDDPENDRPSTLNYTLEYGL